MARYSKGSQQSVKKAMHKKKKGQLRSGRSGKKVTSRKQAIAIGLSEARKKGQKVPAAKRKNSKTAKTKTAKKRGRPKKTATRRPGRPRKTSDQSND
jgi:topoisomerase IA-like protein